MAGELTLVVTPALGNPGSGCLGSRQMVGSESARRPHD
jgi:hypothetical protein